MTLEMDTKKRNRAASTIAPKRGGVLQRACACGNHTPGGGECESCKKKRTANMQPEMTHRISGRDSAASAGNRLPFGRDLSQIPLSGGYVVQPMKPLGPHEPESDEEKPSPMAGGAATIKCDGAGGYELLLNGWAGANCGRESCVIAHESSHMADWKAKWPKGCDGQAKGYLPKGDPPDNPLMTVAEYKAFLKQSECKAHTADLTCAQALPKTGACKTPVEDYIKLTKDEKAKHCPPGIAGAVGGAILGSAFGLAGAVAGGLIGHELFDD